MTIKRCLPLDEDQAEVLHTTFFNAIYDLERTLADESVVGNGLFKAFVERNLRANKALYAVICHTYGFKS